MFTIFYKLFKKKKIDLQISFKSRVFSVEVGFMVVSVGFGVVGVGTRRIWCSLVWRKSESENEKDGDRVHFELRVFSSKIGTKVQFWIFFN